VPKGEVRAFYIATTIPNATGVTRGTVTLVGSDGAKYDATVSISVAGAAIVNGGDDEIWRETRVVWLNSKLGLGGNSTRNLPLLVMS
jgi:hypothetical protein